MRDQNIPVLTSSVFPKHTNLSDELELQINFIYHMIYFNTHRKILKQCPAYWFLICAIYIVLTIFNNIGYAFGQYYVVIRLYFC